MLKKTLFSLYLLCIGFSGITQDLEKLSEKTDQYFRKYISDKKTTPGAVVVAIKDGKVMHKGAYGYANLEHKIPLATNSVFDIASVSKQFVGYSVAKLVSDKKLSLEDDVRSYIPELPDFGHTITIKHLLFHQSGLRDWPRTLKLSGVDFNDVITFEHILDMAFQQKELNFIPGEKYVYSNTGYNILVEVIQRVTKQSFREWTNENIFAPLEMNDTFFKDRYNEIVPNKVESYFREDDQRFLSTNNLTALGSSSLQTTIDDLAKWLLYMDSKEGEKYISMMKERGSLNSGEITNYAYGLEEDKYKGLQRFSHDGIWASFTTYLAYLPEKHFSVAVLLNTENWAQGFAQGVMDIYLENEFTSGDDDGDSDGEKKPTIPKDLTLDLKSYTGVYFLEMYMVYITVTEEDGKLYTQATDEDKQLMTPVSDKQFWVDAYSSSINYNKNADGEFESVIYHGKVCKRMPSIQSTDKSALEAFTGVYQSEELNANYNVILEDGKLYLSHVRNGKVALNRVWNDGFTTEAFYMPIVSFQRNEKGEIASFTASTYRSRNQKFMKASD